MVVNKTSQKSNSILPILMRIAYNSTARVDSNKPPANRYNCIA